MIIIILISNYHLHLNVYIQLHSLAKYIVIFTLIIFNDWNNFNQVY